MADMRRTLAAVAAVCAAATALHADPVAILVGRPAVQDGDGLLFGQVEVRLQGIAAPEWSGAAGYDPGGDVAAAALTRLVNGREVRCELDGTVASSNRPVGICFADGEDLGQVLVAEGVARDCARFSGGRYAEAEAEARRAGRDLSRIYDLPGYCRPR